MDILSTQIYYICTQYSLGKFWKVLECGLTFSFPGLFSRVMEMLWKMNFWCKKYNIHIKNISFQRINLLIFVVMTSRLRILGMVFEIF